MLCYEMRCNVRWRGVATADATNNGLVSCLRPRFTLLEVHCTQTNVIAYFQVICPQNGSAVLKGVKAVISWYRTYYGRTYQAEIRTKSGNKRRKFCFSVSIVGPDYYGPP